MASSLPELVEGMNRLSPQAPLDLDVVAGEVRARDREMANQFTKDAQIAALRQARSYRGDRLIRVAPPHRLLDPSAGPLIAVKLHVLTRKTDRKSTRLNSSHVAISYAVFCLKKKNTNAMTQASYTLWPH